jgi:hypothetical protein
MLFRNQITSQKATEKELASIATTAIGKIWRMASHIVYLACLDTSDGIDYKVSKQASGVTRSEPLSL